MKKSKAEKKSAPDDLPLKAALDELAFVRKAFRDVTAHYASELEGDLAAIREALTGLAGRKKLSAECAHHVRDMLMLMRGLEVKPEKGRRRDFKKIEALVKELRRVVDGWE